MESAEAAAVGPEASANGASNRPSSASSAKEKTSGRPPTTGGSVRATSPSAGPPALAGTLAAGYPTGDKEPRPAEAGADCAAPDAAAGPAVKVGRQTVTGKEAASSVIVAVRARPLGDDDGALALSVECPNVIMSPGKNERVFQFDNAYDGQVGQATIYRDVGAPILRKALQGFNATIFAYGQTGSGKSHTMMGTGDDFGIIPRMSEELFFCVDKSLKEAPERKFLLTCSYLEIYNEALLDLLAPSGGKRGAPKEALDIREHQKLGVYVKGLLEMPVRSRTDLVKHMTEGNSRRATGETKMNARSSRSHSIFIISIQQQETVEDSDKKRELWSKINLVDLAGSERAGKTGAEGARMKEGISINQSLSALGAVITALAESATKGKAQFVPYRNSKLTRVLQESLGGNSLTLMIANVSSAIYNYDETVNTLQYADRAKNIQVKATKNEQMSEVGQLKQEVELLKRKLSEQGCVARTDEEELQLQQYRSQIEEYELRLQQSFEEKARACAELADRLKQQQLQAAEEHQRRRTQFAEQGEWVQVLSQTSPAWDVDFLANLAELRMKQREGEERLERCDSYISVLFTMLQEAVQQWEQGWGVGVDAPMDLTKTVDLGSTQGGRVLGQLAGRDEQGKLQQLRHLSLRWQALTDQLQQSDQLRSACAGLYKDACWSVGKHMWRDRRMETQDAEEAEKDSHCATSCLDRRMQELQGNQKHSKQVLQCNVQMQRMMLRSLQEEATRLEVSAGSSESEGAGRQRRARRQEALDVMAQLEALRDDSEVQASSPVLLASLQALERCVGHRLLQRQRSSPEIAAQPSAAAETIPTERDDETKKELEDLRAQVEEKEALRSELETLRKQHQQMLTVIGVQATTIEQVTAGTGQAGERERQQLQVLADQAKQLDALRQELQEQRQVLAEQGSQSGKARQAEHDLLVQAELGEVRIQQSRQMELSEQLLDARARQEHALQDKLTAANRKVADMEHQVEDLKDQVATQHQQMEQQAAELVDARSIEQQFARLAAEMGCVDAEGRMMREQLEEVTADLIKTKASEAEYYEWLQDVKRMMANGREDGLAMALAENMTQCRRKDRVIHEKEEEIRQLRADKARLRQCSAPPAKDSLATTSSSQTASKLPGRARPQAKEPPQPVLAGTPGWTTTAAADSPGPVLKSSLASGLVAQGTPAVASRSLSVRAGSVGRCPSRGSLPRASTPRGRKR